MLREVDVRIFLLGRLVGCFSDGRNPERIEHELSEMLAQRIHGLALGYEDLNDQEQLRWIRYGVLSGKQELDQPLAGKSTLNPELNQRSKRYHKISYSNEALDQLLVDLYLESHAAPPAQIVLDLHATYIPLTAISRRDSSTAITTATAICPRTSSPAISCCVHGSGRPTRMRRPVR